MTDRFADDARIERAPAALSRWVLDGVLVLAPGMSEALKMSTPGDGLWELLAEPLTVSELVNALSVHYDQPVDMVRTHIQPVLDALYAGGAVLVVPPFGDRHD